MRRVGFTQNEMANHLGMYFLFLELNNKKPNSKVLIFYQGIIRQPCSEFNYGTSYTAKEYA